MAGLTSAGVDALLLGVVPTPAVRLGVGRRRHPRGGDLGVAQPVRRQRHQAVRRRRPQAARRGRGGHRGATMAASRRPGRPLEAPTSAASSPSPTTEMPGLVGRPAPSTATSSRPPHRRRLRPTAPRRAVAVELFADLGADVDGDRRPARRHQHQRAVRRHPPAGPPAGRRRARRRPRPGPRRRRRPLPGRRRRRCRWSTATRSSPCSPSTGASRGALPADTVVVTVMTNLGFRQAMAAHDITVVDTAVGDRLRARGRWRPAASRSAASSPAT